MKCAVIGGCSAAYGDVFAALVNTGPRWPCPLSGCLILTCPAVGVVPWEQSSGWCHLNYEAVCWISSGISVLVLRFVSSVD